MAPPLDVYPVSAQRLAERAGAMIPGYEAMFARRGDITPSDPLQFHLFHLARYWSRSIAFSRKISQPERCIEGDLGACIQVGSEFAHKLIDSNSPIYARWQDYWAQAQAVLHRRPVTMAAVEAASQSFNDCIAELKYDPWG